MIVQCTQCGVDSKKKPYDIKNSKNHFCSKECKSNYEKIDRFTSIIKRIKNRCKTTDIEFNITENYLKKIWKEQNKRCALTGEELFLGLKKDDPKQTASVDRINSKYGYIEGNIWWVHKDVNMAKQSFSLDYFIRLCEKVSRFHEKFQYKLGRCTFRGLK